MKRVGHSEIFMKRSLKRHTPARSKVKRKGMSCKKAFKMLGTERGRTFFLNIELNQDGNIFSGLGLKQLLVFILVFLFLFIIFEDLLKDIFSFCFY